MVKKKTTKTRKGVVGKRKPKVKTKVKTKTKESKDTKQDKALKGLKAELKKLAKQVLDNAKMKLPQDKFRKLKTSVMDKFNMANTRRRLDKLGNNLLTTPYGSIPKQLERDIRASLTTAKEDVKKSVKKELDDPIKQYNQMKKDLNDVIEKYNNGELSVVEVAVAYKSAKKFANTVGEYLPTVSELNTTYRSVKNKLNYLRSWVGSRLRSGDSITEIQNLPPPPPSPSPDPPPPPPEDSQAPSPTPTPQPTMSKMYDSAKQTIENVSPYIPAQALAGIGMLEGGRRLMNRFTNTGRNRDIVRDRMEGAGGTMIGQLAQLGRGQATQAVINQLSRESLDTQRLLNEAEEVIQTGNDYLERQTNRQPLRQVDREIRDRQQMGNNLKDRRKMRMSKFASKSAPATEMKFPQREPPTPEEMEQMREDIAENLMDERFDELAGTTGTAEARVQMPELDSSDEDTMNQLASMEAVADMPNVPTGMPESGEARAMEIPILDN